MSNLLHKLCIFIVMFLGLAEGYKWMSTRSFSDLFIYVGLFQTGEGNTQDSMSYPSPGC